MDMIQFARASMTADSIAFSMPALRTLLEESTAHYMGTLTKDDYGDFRVEDDTLHLGYDSPIRMELTIAMQNQKLSEHNRISFLTTEFETRFGWTPPMGRGVTRKPEAYLFPAFDAATKINLDLKTEFQEGFNYYEYATELEDVASTPRRRSYDPRPPGVLTTLRILDLVLYACRRLNVMRVSFILYRRSLALSPAGLVVTRGQAPLLPTQLFVSPTDTVSPRATPRSLALGGPLRLWWA